jgi:hypothetical protein
MDKVRTGRLTATTGVASASLSSPPAEHPARTSSVISVGTMGALRMKNTFLPRRAIMVAC